MNLLTHFARLLGSLLLIFVLFAQTNAATKTFTGPGNFGDATKWSGGTLPLAGDDLILNGTCTVNNSVSTDNVAYGALTIGGSSAGTLNWAASGTNRLRVTNVNSSIAGSSLDMTNGGTFICTGSWTATNLSFTPGTGTVERQLAIGGLTTYTTYNNLIINTSGTISTGVGITVNGNLTVTSGTFSVGAYSLAVTGTTTVTSTFTISSATGTKSFGNLTINGTFNNTAANVPFSVSGNLQNNGTFNGGTGRVTFTGASSTTVSGTAGTTAFGGGITVNKGVANTNVLDVQSVITMSAGGLTLTNGTFKLSSASTITPFTANITSSPYLIPSTAGLWCNGGTMNTNPSIDWTTNGLLKVSAGTVYVGSAAEDRLIPQSLTAIVVEGGVLEFAGRISNSATAFSFTMTGGVTKFGTVGNTMSGKSPCDIDAVVSFNMSGGTIIIVRPGGTAGQNLGYQNLSTSGTGFTGGTLQIGDGSTPAASIMGITSTRPIYNLTINSANATAQLTTSALTVTNDVTITSGALTSNNLNMTVGGNWANNGSFTAGTGRVTFNGTGTHTVTGTSTTAFNTLTVNKGTSYSTNILDVQSTITMASGGLTLTNGTFKLSSASTITPFTADIITAPYLIPSTAGIWVNGGVVSTTSDVTSAGLVRVSNGTFTVGNAADSGYLSAWSTVIIEGGAFNVAGRFTRRDPAEGQYFTMTGGTMTVPTVGSTSTLYSPFFMDDPGCTFTMSGGTIVIPRSGGADLGFVNYSGTSNVTGGTLQIGNASTPASSTIHVKSTVAMWNLTVNAYNSPIAYMPTYALTLKNDLMIAGGTLNANGLALTVKGDWTNNGTFIPGTNTVTLNGTSSQNISGTSATTFYNLVLNNALGVTLYQSAAVSNALTLTDGPLDLNSRTLTISNPNPAAITAVAGYLISEQVNNSSKVAWNIGTTLGAHVFPFGALGDMIPLTVDLTAGDIGTVTASTYHTNPANLPYPTTPTLVSGMVDQQGNDNSANVADRFWQLDKTGPSGTATLSFVTAGSEIGLIEGVVAQRWNSTAVAWDEPIPGQANIFNGVTVEGATLMGPWALVAGTAPLPVELLNFEAYQKEEEVLVKWTTATEINSDFFEVERSMDGLEFETVAKVEAAERSTAVLHYQTVDKDPLSGISYYRLRQVDQDGSATLSSRVQVNYSRNAKPYLVCVPNPTTAENIHLRIYNAKDKEMVVQLTDLRGTVIMQETIQVADEMLTYDIAPNLRLAPGMYIAGAVCAQESYHVRVIVK